MDQLKLGMKASGDGYNQLRDALAIVESSNNPGAIQRNTKAVGLYQFIPRYWDKFFQEETGRPLSSFLPKNQTPAEYERASREQKQILFPKYFEKELAPFVAETRRKGIAGKLSDIQIATAYHKLGAAAATKYFTTGFDASAGTKDNEAIGDYIAKVEKYVGRAPGSYTPGPNKTLVAATYTNPAASGASTTVSMNADAATAENQRVMMELNKLAAKLRDQYS